MRFVLLEAPTAEATPAEETTQQTASGTESDDLGYDPSKMTKGKGLNDEFVKGLLSLKIPELNRILGYVGKKAEAGNFKYKDLSAVGKTFVDALKRLIEIKRHSAEEIFDWIERNSKNLYLIKDNDAAKNLYYLTGEMMRSAQAELQDIYLDPSLWDRSKKDFQYSAIILVAVSSPALRRVFFKGNDEVSLDGLIDSGKVKPSGLDTMNKDDTSTIYGQVETWSSKNKDQSYNSFSDATEKLRSAAKGGKISSNTVVNITSYLKFKNGKWIEVKPNK